MFSLNEYTKEAHGLFQFMSNELLWVMLHQSTIAWSGFVTRKLFFPSYKEKSPNHMAVLPNCRYQFYSVEESSTTSRELEAHLALGKQRRVHIQNSKDFRVSILQGSTGFHRSPTTEKSQANCLTTRSCQGAEQYWHYLTNISGCVQIQLSILSKFIT